MILAGSDTASTPDLSTCYWDGSSWGGYANHDTNIESTANTRGFDFAWESTGSKGLLVYGDDPLDITYNTFTAPSGWGGQTDVSMGTYSHPSVQLSTNPSPVAGGPKILGAVMEDTVNDLGAIKWNGTTFTVIGTSTLTADTGTTSYDAFEMEYWTNPLDQLLVYHNWTGVPAGDSYTLQVKGYTEDESINVQVLTPP